jgi:hypothetical protein
MRQRLEVLLKVLGYGVDRLLRWRGRYRRHRLTAFQASHMPLSFDAEMSDDEVDRVRLRKRLPANFLLGQIVERLFQGRPNARVHLKDNS